MNINTEQMSVQNCYTTVLEQKTLNDQQLKYINQRKTEAEKAAKDPSIRGPQKLEWEKYFHTTGYILLQNACYHHEQQNKTLKDKCFRINREIDSLEHRIQEVDEIRREHFLSLHSYLNEKEKEIEGFKGRIAEMNQLVNFQIQLGNPMEIHRLVLQRAELADKPYRIYKEIRDALKREESKGLSVLTENRLKIKKASSKITPEPEKIAQKRKNEFSIESEKPSKQSRLDVLLK